MSTGLACVSEKLKLWNADGLWDSLNIFRYLIWVLLLLCPKRVQCIPFSTHFHEQYAFFQIWSAKTQWFFHPVRIEDDRFVQSPVFEDLESWSRRCWDAPAPKNIRKHGRESTSFADHLSSSYLNGHRDGVYPMAKLRIICVTQTGSPSTEFSLGKEVLIPSILAMLEYYHWDFMKNPRQGCRNADAIGATGHSLKFILILLIFWSFISHCKSFYYLDFPLVSLVKSLNRLNYSYLIGLS